MRASECLVWHWTTRYLTRPQRRIRLSSALTCSPSVPILRHSVHLVSVACWVMCRFADKRDSVISVFDLMTPVNLDYLHMFSVSSRCVLFRSHWKRNITPFRWRRRKTGPPDACQLASAFGLHSNPIWECLKTGLNEIRSRLHSLQNMGSHFLFWSQT